ARRVPADWPGGVRHVGDVSLVCCSRMERGKVCLGTAFRGERERPKRAEPSRTAAAPGCSACRPSRAGSPRRSWPAGWRRRSNRSSTQTATGSGRTGRPWTRWRPARERCWKSDWIVDLEIGSFFDGVPWRLVVKAVAAHSADPWLLLYLRRWLSPPLPPPLR